MNNKFSLTQIDDYFHIDSTLRDYGNARRSAQSLKTNWIVKIINGEFNKSKNLHSVTYS